MTLSRSHNEKTREVEERLKSLSPENVQQIMCLYMELAQNMTNGREVTRVDLVEMLRTTTHLPVPTALTLEEIETLLASALFATDATPATRPYTLEELNYIDRLTDDFDKR